MRLVVRRGAEERRERRSEGLRFTKNTVNDVTWPLSELWN
jgi:hypothetical protein